MTIDPSLPVLLAQLGHTERLAHDSQTLPELARSTAQEVAKEALRHDHQQVQKSENAEHSPGVDTRQEQGRRRGPPPRRHARKKPPPPDDDTPDDTDDPENPWTGNFVNIKV